MKAITPNDPKMTLPEVLAVAGVTVPTLNEMIGTGIFPQPVRISTRLRRWDREEVSRWWGQQLKARPKLRATA